MNINIFLHEKNLESVVCLIVFGLVFYFVSLCFSVVYRACYFCLLYLFICSLRYSYFQNLILQDFSCAKTTN